MFRKNKDNELDYKAINHFFKSANNLLKIGGILIIILGILLGTYLIKEWNILRIIGTILSIVSPVFIGFVIAWLLDPLATKLAKKMPRVLACITTYLLIFGVLALLLILVVPTLSSGMSDIASAVPEIVDNVQEFASDTLEKFGDSAQVESYKETLLSRIEEVGSNIANELPNSIWNFGKGLISISTNIVLGLMIGFYLLFDFRKFQGHLLSLMPRAWHNGAKDLIGRINGKLRNYVQGVFLIMFLVFITQSIGFTLAGLEAPMLFALFCAITDVIPYIGPWIGGAPAVIVGLTMDPMIGVFCLISVLICQLLENNFYQPLIMGKAMKLHPVTIMLGLLLFNYFFGMIGMIVATPVIATIKIIIEFVMENTELGQRFNDYQENNKKTMRETSTKELSVKES
ncbi:MAG TPA: AI-2E family transporter [Candidatus Onthousia faecavium]|nr:AI-2E family transporter [Candidatus Onthousia faecavium]